MRGSSQVSHGNRLRRWPSPGSAGAARWGDVLRRVLGGRRAATGPDAGARLWARRIEAESEIPAAFREACATLGLPGRLPFPYTVVTPASEAIDGFPENEKLVRISGDHVHVLENTPTGISMVGYAQGDIFYVERGTLLLYSWIGIHGRTLQGVPSSTILKFNTVTEHFMAPIIECLRPLPDFQASGPSGAGSMAHRPPDPIDLKFMNYARSSLRPGDDILLSIYQPEIRRGLAGRMGLSFTWPIAPAHLVLLTRRELILIRDDENQRPHQGSPYGAISTYVPLSRISSTAIANSRGGLIALQIHLSAGVDLELKWPASRLNVVEELAGSLRAQETAGR
jgi:hypothetical protein